MGQKLTKNTKLKSDDQFGRILHKVSKQIGTKWKEVAREIQIAPFDEQEPLIQEIEDKHRGQLREQTYQALLAWKAYKGNMATVDKLIEGLHLCQLRRVAEYVDDLREQLSDNPTSVTSAKPSLLGCFTGRSKKFYKVKENIAPNQTFEHSKQRDYSIRPRSQSLPDEIGKNGQTNIQHKRVRQISGDSINKSRPVSRIHSDHLSDYTNKDDSGDFVMDWINNAPIDDDGVLMVLETDSDSGVKTADAASAIDDAVLEAMKLCQATLKEHYKRCMGWVQPIPWVSDIQLQLKDVYAQLEIALKDKKSNIIEHKRQELLDSISSLTTPKRVLLEGPAGIGKTTFIRKLAFDWAESDLEQKLDQYKLVFVIDCSQFLQGTLENAIFEQLLPDDTLVNKDALSKFISLRQHEVLFLIDGFDELPYAQKPYMNRVLEAKVLMSSCIVLTSRADQPEHLSRFMDLHFIVQGFSKQSTNDYVKKYFDRNEKLAQELLSKIFQDTFLQNLAENPLHLALLCLLWESNAGMLPSTLTKLYVQIVLCLVKRFCQRTNRPEPKAEHFSELSTELQSFLKQFGDLALNSFKKEIIGFGEKYLDENVENSAEILQLGLLTQEGGTSLLKQDRFWVFVNKSFQEFFSAYFITQSENKYEPSFVRSFLLRHRNVLIFVIGLLNEASGPIFEVLRKSHLSKEFLLRCLAESDSGMQLAEIIEPELVKNNCFQFNSTMCGDVRGITAAAHIINSLSMRCKDPATQQLLFGLLLSEKHVLSSDFSNLLLALKSSTILSHFFLELPAMQYSSRTHHDLSQYLQGVFNSAPLESICLISSEFRKDDILKSLGDKDGLKTLLLNIEFGEIENASHMVEMVLKNRTLEYLVLMFLSGESKNADSKVWNKGVQKLLTLLKAHNVKSAILYAGKDLMLDACEHWDTWAYRYFECPYYFDTVVTHHIHQIYAAIMTSHKDDVIQGLCDELHALGGSFGVDVFLYFKE